MTKLLITGGAGFIGNAIIDYLTQTKAFEIVVLDCFSKQIHGEHFEASYLFKNIQNKAKIIHGDVRNKEDLKKALEGVDYVIHLAAETGTGQSMYEITRYTDVNLMGTANLLDLIVNEKIPVKKIILASSRSVYGEGLYQCKTHGNVVPSFRDVSDMASGDFSNKCPICHGHVDLLATHEASPITPISYYAYTKYAQEKMLETMCPMMGVEYTIFRYQNVYGPGQSLNNPYTGILSIFSKLLLADKPINIFEDGLESRDFVHVSDIAIATCSALTNEKTNAQIINVGTGESISVIEVAETMKRLYGSNSVIKVTGDFRKGDIRHNRADITRLKTLCEVQPQYKFEQGIQEFTKWASNELKDEDLVNDEKRYQASLDELLKTGNMIVGAKNDLKEQ